MILEQFKKRAHKIPDAPGVYFFLGKNKKVLYIGKATSLRDRVRSYFSKDLMEARGPLLVHMLGRAQSIEWRQTDSVLEALLLEGSLIRSYKPHANTDSKDDKTYNHVVTTKEDFPQILLIRGSELERKTQNYRKVFGPYPHGLQLKEALKLLRKIFPYRDERCHPNQGRPCFNRQIGLCPGVCTGEISKEEYKKTVRHIEMLFDGKKRQVLRSIEKEMKRAAKDMDFERAKELRRQLFALQHIQDVSLIKDEYRLSSRSLGGGGRIEAYDIAHLRGSAPVGVMVVVEGGAAKKAAYRKFRIRSAKPGDDTGALREVLSRRLGHDEWPLPRIIAVDGGRAQIHAAAKVLEECGVHIPVVGVTKDERHRPRAIVGDRDLIKDRERDILLANAEAHRFAINFHRKRSRKESGL